MEIERPWLGSGHQDVRLLEGGGDSVVMGSWPWLVSWLVLAYELWETSMPLIFFPYILTMEYDELWNMASTNMPRVLKWLVLWVYGCL